MAVGSLALFYKGNSTMGPYFQVFILYLVVQKVCLAIAALLLLLRVFNIVKDRAHLLYVMCGTFNLGVAVIGIVLYFSGKADLAWLNLSIVNLMAAFLITVDIFVLEYVFEKSRQ